jgi:hypothetical protein
MQSHGGQVRRLHDHSSSVDDRTDALSPARFARRRLLKSALFGVPDGRDEASPAQSATVVNSEVTHAVIGTVLDVSPHVLVLQTAAGEERLTLAASTAAWRGRAVAPAALRQGDRAIVKRNYARRAIADRIWAEIGRVTGTVVEREAGTLLVDEGIEKGRKILVIPPHATGRIQVRFPRLQPGYLIDVIGLRRPGFVEGLIPATSQPPYRADQPPSPPMVSGHIPDSISGTATWHEPGEEPADLLGVGYPALDPETGCEGHHRAQPDPVASLGDASCPSGGRHTRTPGGGHITGVHGEAPYVAAVAGHDPTLCTGGFRRAERYAVDPHLAGPGCVRLPYLSLGSVLQIRNDCTQRARDLPVTSCGASARLFCDRCVTCGTSPRGRVADLTMSAFVDLGGDLDRGCFNATITIGG